VPRACSRNNDHHLQASRARVLLVQFIFDAICEVNNGPRIQSGNEIRLSRPCCINYASMDDSPRAITSKVHPQPHDLARPM